MKFTRKYGLIVVLLIVAVVGCKKYGSDSKFTLRTPMNRITGTWQITKYEVDGIDSLQYFTFYGNDEFVVDKKKFTIMESGYSYAWEFYSKKRGISTFYPFNTIEKFIDSINGADTIFFNGIGSRNTSWNIERLTNSKMTITQLYKEHVFGDSNYVAYQQIHRITCQKIKK